MKNVVICIVCGKSFIYHSYPSKTRCRGLFCSRDCRANQYPPREFRCENCGKVFAKRQSPSRKAPRFCSTECHRHRATPDDYRELARSRGFVWLGSQVPNGHTKTEWRCGQGHIWKAPYYSIKQGAGCSQCAHVAPLTLDDYRTLASERGFVWTEESVAPRALQPTQWTCGRGHSWKAPYNRIKTSKGGCPYCSHKRPLTEHDYHALAQRKGFEWIGEELPANISVKTRWRCGKNHEWKAAYNSFTGCPFCSTHKPLTAGNYADLAAEHGFFWIGQFPKNQNTKTLWQCQRGHCWESTYHNVAGHSGLCPHCKNYVNGTIVSSQQRFIYNMMGGTLNLRLGRYTLDVAISAQGVNIAIEYDGQRWHEGNEAHDARRDAYLHAHGWRVLHIKASKALPTREQLDAAITALVSGALTAEIVLDWRETST